MRIGFVVPRCTPDNSHGRYVIGLATRLAAERDVTVYAGAFWPPLPSAIRRRQLPVPNRPAVARLAALWSASLAAMQWQRFDIVHIQGADAPVGNVVTAHCCNAAMREAAPPTPTLRRRANYAIGIAVERYCFAKPATRAVIAVSNKVKEEIERHYGVESRKIVVLAPGVDTELFHPRHRDEVRPAVRGRLRLAPDDFVVAFVGGDYRLKGLVPLLESVRVAQAPVNVLAIGVTADAALRGLVAREGLVRRVRFLGNVADIASLYAAADCFVLPTRYDTFSLATLEAMASGLPVIVSRAAGVSEHLTDGVDALLLDDPDDTEIIAGHLRRLADDPGLRAELSRAARRTAEQHSWERVVEQTLVVYGRVLGW